MAERAAERAAAPPSETEARRDPTPDPLDPRKVSLDVFELYCRGMLATDLADVGTRCLLVEHLQYMMQRLIRSQHDYGRLYNRTIITNIVARVCGRHPYAIPDDVEEGAPARHYDGCLVDFDAARWDLIRRQLQQLRDCLLRRDAAWTVLPFPRELEGAGAREGEDDDRDEEAAPEPDDEIDEALASHVDFTESYAAVSNLIKFHFCLSHLQPHPHTIVQGADSVTVHPDSIAELRMALKEEFSDEQDSEHARVLSDVLEALDKGGPGEKSDDDVREIHAKHARLFCLQHFQQTFLRLIRRWEELVLPMPELARIGYGTVAVAPTTRQEEHVSRSGQGQRERPAQGDDGTPDPASRKEDKESVGAFSGDEAGEGGDAQCLERKRHANPGSERRQLEHPAQGEHETPIASSRKEDDDSIDSFSDDKGDEDEVEEGENVQHLKQKRDALMKNVTDPLAHCIAAAQSAQTSQRTEPSPSANEASHREQNAAAQSADTMQKAEPSLSADEASQREERVGKKRSLHSKKSGVQLSFDSGESDASTKDGALSAVPAKYTSPPRAQPLPVIRVSRPAARKRVRFTTEEDGAIREGIEKYGFGNWAEIKANFCLQLSNRSGVQIKDRARTLGING